MNPSDLASSNLGELYRLMFEAKQSEDHATAEKLMLAIEEQRTQAARLPDPQLIESQLSHLPEFARQVLWKSQIEVGRPERSNCINAAFNYHDVNPHWETYSTTEFLDRIQNEYFQISPEEDAKRGDLIALWSRTGGSWDHRKIDVHEMDRSAPDFPYGLVFDHVAVRLDENLVFHKPDPTLESRYQIELLEAIKVVTAQQPGFEVTLHRKKK